MHVIECQFTTRDSDATAALAFASECAVGVFGLGACDGGVLGEETPAGPEAHFGVLACAARGWVLDS